MPPDRPANSFALLEDSNPVTAAQPDPDNSSGPADGVASGRSQRRRRKAPRRTLQADASGLQAERYGQHQQRRDAAAEPVHAKAGPRLDGGAAAARDAGAVNGSMDHAAHQQSSGELNRSVLTGTSGDLTDEEVLRTAGGTHKRHLRSASIPDALMRPSRSAAASAADSDSDASTFGGYASADGDVVDEWRCGLPPLARFRSSAPGSAAHADDTVQASSTPQAAGQPQTGLNGCTMPPGQQLATPPESPPTPAGRQALNPNGPPPGSVPQSADRLIRNARSLSSQGAQQIEESTGKGPSARHAMAPLPTVEEAPRQTFADYFEAEMNPGPSFPTADVVWGQTERDRVYNALVYVPYQLERLLWFGTFICCDSFLAVFTALPLRTVNACLTVGRGWQQRLSSLRSGSMHSSSSLQPPSAPSQPSSLFAAADTPASAGPQPGISQRQAWQQASLLDSGGGGVSRGPQPSVVRFQPVDAPSVANAPPPGQHTGSGVETAAGAAKQEQQRSGEPPRLRGDQVFDLICVFIFLVAVATLQRLDAGAMYFWMKDLTQEFLKLSIIYSSVEIFDKIFCSFGVDTLEALASTCTLYAVADRQRGQFRHLLADSVLALLLVVGHAIIIMCQGMAFSVAMNSKRSNAIVALLIASNFAEIKGVVLKRFDPRRLLILSFQDIVERFHLVLALAFVLVEEMANNGRWRPDAGLLRTCAYFFGFEIIIDVTKHAVLGKFNEIRPGVYREFMKDVAEKLAAAQSHSAHHVVAFEPLAPAALFVRIALTFAAIRSERWADTSWLWILVLLVATATGWAALFAAKLALGFALKRAAAAYVDHYDSHSKSRAGSATKGGKMPQAAVGASVSWRTKME